MLVETGGSKFVQAGPQGGLSRLLEVLDEHMEWHQTIVPKKYAAVIRQLKD